MKKLDAARMVAVRKLKRVNRDLPMLDFDWYIPTDTPHQTSPTGGYWIPVMVYVAAPRRRSR